MSRSINLAVIPGDGIGQEVVAEGLKVLDAVLPPGREAGDQGVRPRRQALARTGETLPDADLDAAQAARRDPARRHRRPVASRPASWSAGCCSSCASPSTTTSTCARRKLFPGIGDARWPAARDDRLRRRPRGHRGPVHRQRRRASAPAPRTRSPPRSASTPPTASSASSATPSRRAQARPRKKLTLVHKNNVLVHAGHLWKNIFDKVGAGVPRGHHRLPARRRRDDLPRHAARALRRDRHRQPLRRHHHRPRRRRLRRHRPGRHREHQPDRRVPVDVRAGPRLGARTSRARARPTRPPPSCRSPCCCATSATRPRPPASRTPSPPTSPSATGTPAAPPTRSATRSPHE